MELVEIEFFIRIIIGYLLGALSAFTVAKGANYLDDIMDFGGIFWKLRFNLAKKASTKLDKKETSTPYHDMLQENLRAAFNSEYEDQPAIMRGAYEQIAEKQLSFIRWICPTCMAGYFSIFSFMIGLVLLLMLSFHWSTILFFALANFSLTHYFVKNQNISTLTP